MQRYFVDHTAGKRGRDARLVLGDGRPVFGMHGCESVLDQSGRVGWYARPSANPLAASHEIQVHRMRHTAAGRPTHVASVSRDGLHRERFEIAVHDAGFAPPGALAFSYAPAEQVAGVRNGFSAPQAGVWDLWLSGQPVARHWATLGPQYTLASSVFDVYGEHLPLPELVLLCMARFIAWRPVRQQHGSDWSPF